MAEDKSTRVKKGCIAVRVGLEEEDGGGGGSSFRRFVIPISHLHHPLFKTLLDAAGEVYGFGPSSGPLRLPCSVDDFLHVLWLIERQPPSSSHRHSHSHRHGHPHPHSSFSLTSC